VPARAIVLIKGCDKVRSWQHATFRSAKKGGSITFSGNISVPGAPSTVVAELCGAYTVTRDLSPEMRNSDHLIAPGGPPVFDIHPTDHAYTVFARFYRIAYSKTVTDVMKGTRTVKISDNNRTTRHSLPQVIRTVFGRMTSHFGNNSGGPTSGTEASPKANTRKAFPLRRTLASDKSVANAKSIDALSVETYPLTSSLAVSRQYDLHDRRYQLMSCSVSIYVGSCVGLHCSGKPTGTAWIEYIIMILQEAGTDSGSRVIIVTHEDAHSIFGVRECA
jgi:hypothetical protein